MKIKAERHDVPEYGLQDLRAVIGDVVNKVVYTMVPAIIQRNGKPVAMIVPYDENLVGNSDYAPAGEHSMSSIERHKERTKRR